MNGDVLVMQYLLNNLTYQIKNNMENPMLDSATFQFSQEANCVDGGDMEVLTIRCESSLGIDRDEGCFYILKTDQWAIDSLDDLKELFDRISKVISK
jgi:hypothetical protein